MRLASMPGQHAWPVCLTGIGAGPAALPYAGQSYPRSRLVNDSPTHGALVGIVENLEKVPNVCFDFQC